MDLFNKNYSELSLTELNVLLNKVKTNHDTLKETVLGLISEYEKIEKKINLKFKEIKELEDSYVKIINEITNRNGV